VGPDQVLAVAFFRWWSVCGNQSRPAAALWAWHKGHDVTHSLPSRKGPVHARGNGTRAPMPAIEELMLAMEVGGAFPG
jgi:hypothetical protein